MIATLARLVERSGAAISELSLDGKPICYTLCEAWRGNQKNISCIPDGEYDCAIVESKKFGKDQNGSDLKGYEIKGVPGRTHILMHTGNTIEDTEGCELYGTTVMLDSGGIRTLESRKAMAKFMAATKGEPFKLKVITTFKRK